MRVYISVDTAFFVFESDSQNIISWFHEPSIVSWKFQNTTRKNLMSFGHGLHSTVAHIQKSSIEDGYLLVRIRIYVSCLIEDG